MALVLASVAAAQSTGGGFAISREVIAGGGGHATGGDFSAVTTTAQPTLGVAQGGGFVLRGGFHVPAGTPPPLGSDIFRNGFEASP